MMTKLFSLAVLVCLLLLPTAGEAKRSVAVFSAEVVGDGDTVLSDPIDMRGSDGFFSLIGRVVSATHHREVQVDILISADNTNYVLDNTAVADWSVNMTDSDAWQKVGSADGITIGKAMQVRIRLIGLTDAAATVDMRLVF